MQPSIIIIASLIIVLVPVYLVLIRPWQLHWGANDGEIKRDMPGDEIVKHPTFNATRAVTIYAPAEYIYPWIVQMGVGRAGWYSYDLLDNLARKSAETILPEYQNPQVSEVIAMSPDGKQGMRVKDFQHNQWMLWWDTIGDSTWAWEIYPEGEISSRLVTRVRVKYRWLSLSILFSLLIEFIDILMMRKCMLNIKRRAETFSTTLLAEGKSNS